MQPPSLSQTGVPTKAAAALPPSGQLWRAPMHPRGCFLSCGISGVERAGSSAATRGAVLSSYPSPSPIFPHRSIKHLGFAQFEGLGFFLSSQHLHLGEKDMLMLPCLCFKPDDFLVTRGSAEGGKANFHLEGAGRDARVDSSVNLREVGPHSCCHAMPCLTQG